ncbi:MAG: BrnT family toxin [Burkholderiaceae bacterium]|jgi:uncharacterized DUF497 family protein|nr:BrnT family toxin [Burkholderiaceae bacterium]
MLIEFDPAKDAINFAKHGISLAAAKDFEWDSAVLWLDAREDYGEDRMSALGYVGNCLFYMAYVDRGEVCRVISLRRASSREVKRYAET